MASRITFPNWSADEERHLPAGGAVGSLLEGAGAVSVLVGAGMFVGVVLGVGELVSTVLSFLKNDLSLSMASSAAEYNQSYEMNRLLRIKKVRVEG